MTTRPESVAEPVALEELEDSDKAPQPVRYAAQRVLAAQLRHLPERMLLTRAKSEGKAHRRSESELV